MKKRTIRNLIIIACASLFVTVTAILSLAHDKGKEPVTAQAVTVEANVDVSDCVYGEQKTFDSEITISYKGSEKTAKDGVLICPNGETYVIAEDAFSLVQTGSYTLRYFYNDEAVALIAETKFDIHNDLYATSGSDKSFAYPITSSEMQGQKLESLNDDVTATKENALIVRLEDGSKFTYAKPIDLSKAGADGLASIMRFDLKMFAFDGTTGGTYNFDHWVARGAKVRLTDCYDSSIYVETTLTVQQNNSKPPHYAYDGPTVRASTNMLPNAGIEMPTTVVGDNIGSKEIFVDGVRGRFYLNNYGSGIDGYRWLNTSTTGGELLFDYEKGRLYTRRTATNGTQFTKIVTDFNNKIYGDIKYQPFTTGEVFVSVEFYDYQTAELARIDIFSIGNDDGAYLVNADNLSYKDEVKPIIQSEFIPTKDNFGYVAVGEYFTIPQATATDVNMVGEVEVAVYKNYESAYKTMVSVQNNKFKVSTPDIYYVEYTARDTYGNVQTEVVKVYGVKTIDNQKTVSIDIGEKFASFNAGEAYELSKPTVTTLNDEACLRLRVRIACEGKQDEVLADLYGKEAIDAFFASECTFVPLYAGEYKVSYEYGDNLMQYTEDGVSYKVTAKASEAVNFLDKPFLDRYLIKDAEYSFGKVKAYRYSTGEPVADENVTAYVRFDNGEYTKIPDLNKVKVTGSKTAQLKYVCGDAFVETDVAEIVDVNYASPRKLNIKNYFVQDGFAVGEESSLIYKSTKTTGNAKLSFVNRIGYLNFQLKFMISAGYSNYERLNVILSDVYEPTKKVVISFYNDNADNFVFSVNGGAEYIIDDAFSSDKEKSVSYNVKSNRLTVGNCKEIVLVDFGFSSDTAYLDFECIGLSGIGGIRINSINNQNLTNRDGRDNKEPEFFNAMPARGTYAKGAVVKICPLSYYDVFSPVLNNMKTIAVTNEAGEYMKSVDGVTMNGVDNDPNKTYEVAFTEYGEYYVDYACSDLQNNASTTREFIVIQDMKDPVLTFGGNITEGGTITLNKGDTLIVSYSVEDDTTPVAEIESYITVMDMASHYIYGYHETNQLKFSYAGTFEVTVTCRDKALNHTTKSFIVVVK